MGEKLVPFFSPDGEYGEIPEARVNDALKNGGKLAVRMRSPDGQEGWLPMDRAALAMKNGGIPTAGMPNAIPPKGTLPIRQRTTAEKVAGFVDPGAALGVSMGADKLVGPTGEDTFPEKFAIKLASRIPSSIADIKALAMGMPTPPTLAAKMHDFGTSTFDAMHDARTRGDSTAIAGVKELGKFYAGMVGVDPEATGEAIRNKDFSQVGAEIGVPATELVVGAKLLGRVGAKAPIESTAKTPSGYTQPINRISALSNTDPEVVSRAMPRIQEVASSKPASLMDALNMASNSVNQWFNDLMERPINRGKPGLRQLPAPTVDLPTGVSELQGGNDGGVFPAQSRNTVVAGKPVAGSSSIPEAVRQRMAQSKVGTMAFTVPQSVLGEANPIVDRIGVQASVVPDSVFASKSEPGVQFLTGAEGGPKTSILSQPSVLRSNDPVQLRATLAKLQDIEGTYKMANYSPAEQAAIRAKIAELKPLVEGNKMPTTAAEKTVTLDGAVNELKTKAAEMRSIGHNAVADTIEAKAQELAKQGQIKLRDLNRMREVENANSDAFFNKDNLAQFIDADKSRAQSIISRTLDKFARNTLYSELEKAHPELAKGKIAEMKRQQGALMEIKQNLQDSLKDARTNAAQDLGTDMSIRLRKGVKPALHGGRPAVHISGIADAVKPVSVSELNAIKNSGEMFQPRPSPFAPVNSVAIQNMLANRRRKK
jgi:hypothetical protein